MSLEDDVAGLKEDVLILKEALKNASKRNKLLKEKINQLYIDCEDYQAGGYFNRCVKCSRIHRSNYVCPFCGYDDPNL